MCTIGAALFRDSCCHCQALLPCFVVYVASNHVVLFHINGRRYDNKAAAVINKEAMELGVKNSHNFVLILSPSVFKSAYVKFELQVGGCVVRRECSWCRMPKSPLSLLGDSTTCALCKAAVANFERRQLDQLKNHMACRSRAVV